MIQFSGFDILLERIVSSGTLARAISEVFSLSVDRIGVIGIDDLPPDSSKSDIACVCSILSGDFPFLVSISTVTRDVAAMAEIELAQRLAVVLDVSLLLEFPGNDPYLMWYVTPTKPPEKVGIDPDLHERDAYRIQHSISDEENDI